MNLHRAGHTVTLTDDHGTHDAVCSCGWTTDGERLDVDHAAWEHLRHPDPPPRWVDLFGIDPDYPESA